jgi:hypothetical protein
MSQFINLLDQKTVDAHDDIVHHAVIEATTRYNAYITLLKLIPHDHKNYHKLEALVRTFEGSIKILSDSFLEHFDNIELTDKTPDEQDKTPYAKSD